MAETLKKYWGTILNITCEWYRGTDVDQLLADMDKLIADEVHRRKLIAGKLEGAEALVERLKEEAK